MESPNGIYLLCIKIGGGIDGYYEICQFHVHVSEYFISWIKNYVTIAKTFISQKSLSSLDVGELNRLTFSRSVFLSAAITSRNSVDKLFSIIALKLRIYT